MIIIIPGNPIPLQRHRSFVRNGQVCNYDSQIKDKLIFQKMIRSQICSIKKSPLETGLICELLSKESYQVNLIFFMPYPQSKRRKTMPDLCDIPHIVKPDLDNLVKFVLDCGNGLLWKDDKMINQIMSKKIYDEEPKTIIHIE